MGRDAEPERTADGRYIVVDGRRWRASDPAIPDTLRTELVAELMAARRIQARPRTQDAKVALGERGDPWWEPTEEGRRTRLAATIRTLLRHRDADRTICPSDAARVVGGGDDWRPLMPGGACRSAAGRGRRECRHCPRPGADRPRPPLGSTGVTAQLSTTGVDRGG